MIHQCSHASRFSCSHVSSDMPAQGALGRKLWRVRCLDAIGESLGQGPSVVVFPLEAFGDATVDFTVLAVG